MRTIVYIDGFNLYYGLLKGTSHKWLDLAALFKAVLQPQHQIVRIKYFTARVAARPNDPTAPQRQDIYIRALQAHTPNIDVLKGQFTVKPRRMPLAKPSDAKEFAEVLFTEEKGSDVNLAVHMLNDAWLDAYECAVIASNDSDLSEAVRLVRTGRKKRVIHVPPGDPSIRTPNHRLRQYATASCSSNRNILPRHSSPTRSQTRTSINPPYGDSTHNGWTQCVLLRYTPAIHRRETVFASQ
jgi:uncharacterized LabA/DUF88 family protein